MPIWIQLLVYLLILSTFFTVVALLFSGLYLLWKRFGKNNEGDSGEGGHGRPQPPTSGTPGGGGGGGPDEFDYELAQLLDAVGRIVEIEEEEKENELEPV